MGNLWRTCIKKKYADSITEILKLENSQFQLPRGILLLVTLAYVRYRYSSVVLLQVRQEYPQFAINYFFYIICIKPFLPCDHAA